MTTFETNALEINDLNKNYPGFSLNHLNLTLPSGCILGLIGENGAISIASPLAYAQSASSL